MGNHILDEMMSFSYNERVQCWESVYNFEPSSVLLQHLKTIPSHQAICYDTNSKFPDIKFLLVDQNTPGVRIKLADYFLYLTLGHAKSDALNPSFSVHDQLLHYRLYYPKQRDLLEYWRDPSDHLNNSADYIKPVERSRYLASIIDKFCDRECKSVLEIGCNVGRNIAFLKKDFEVAGVEINANAVNLLRNTYPELAESTIHLGDAGTILTQLPDDAYDIVFSMAVLMHIHPTVDETFWRDIVRVAKRYIVTIENEISSSGRNWARNYQEQFEKYGARCVHCEFHKTNEHLLYGYITRVFDCSNA